jgi:hypothetical protein
MKPGANYCPGSCKRVAVDRTHYGTCPECQRQIRAIRVQVTEAGRTGQLRQHVTRTAPTVWNRGTR